MRDKGHPEGVPVDTDNDGERGHKWTIRGHSWSLDVLFTASEMLRNGRFLYFSRAAQERDLLTNGRGWTQVDEGGRRWTKVDEGGRRWTKVDKRGLFAVVSAWHTYVEATANSSMT